MNVTNFHFLWPEWQSLHEPATKAEGLVYPDPRAACFYARRGLELAVAWLYKHDASLKLPFSDNLSTLIHEPTFRALVGDALFAKAKLIKDLGNLAAHSTKKLTQADSLRATTDLFHLLFWIARNYSRGDKPSDALKFDWKILPQTSVPQKTLAQIQQLEADLAAKDEKLTELLAGKQELDAALQQARDEIAAIKAANVAVDTHDYSEAETRDYFIDLLLKEAGWALDQSRDREYPVSGMPNNEGKGFVDYVLWGDDGRPLALVEAKRTKFDRNKGKQQAKLYADCLEKEFGRRPVIFYSNGYEHSLWDDVAYPPRDVQGFYTKDELELLIQRRTTRKSLATAEVSKEIAGRHYQIAAIRHIAETFERDRQRRALLVMATGAGKTRTIIALSELLMRCNWAKRVLFLADRNALVNQAVRAFTNHMPEVAAVNLVTDKNSEGRVFVSTYPTMMGLIDDSRNDGQRRFGPGHFDLVVIDEAHRSIFKKYRAIFDYFDSLLVGLTATPADQIDRNTYDVFNLETGVPTFAYSLDEAIADGVLVPPKAVSVDLRYPREGIKYDDLTEDEKDEWDAIEWDEDGTIPGAVDSSALNAWLFNEDTVDKVLGYLMQHGQHVAGGDRLGKTIIFAKNHRHAEFISERFDANYPHLKGAFARVIDFQVDYAQSLIDDFSIAAKNPHIAISVDMLDTGIDVPEVVNLVFFKLVRSKTKFWQMVGRGTRLAPDLFGPGQDKEHFFIFDFLGNLEFFNTKPETTEGAGGESLSTRLFRARVDVLGELDRKFVANGIKINDGRVHEHGDAYDGFLDDYTVWLQTAEALHGEVAAMNVDNFVVRPKRKLIETWKKRDAWRTLDEPAREELKRELAGLPNELPSEEEEAKRFDLLLLNLELAVLRGSSRFVALAEKLRAIAQLLSEKKSIPLVAAQMELILEIQSDEWWRDVTVPMLEAVRRKLRGLVSLIEKKERKIVYTDFEDELSGERTFDLIGFPTAGSFERFKQKARHFLKQHETDLVVQKVRMNRPLTESDLGELERLLIDNGVGSEEDLAKAREEADGKLGLFIRSLVGLDRAAAKDAFASFMTGKTLSANQISFLEMIIEHLTERGVMDATLLWSSPYTDVHENGVDGMFSSTEVDQVLAVLDQVRQNAAA